MQVKNFSTEQRLLLRWKNETIQTEKLVIDINLLPDLITEKEYRGRDVDLSYVNFCVFGVPKDHAPNIVTAVK